MRGKFATLVFILIVGISSLVIAQEQQLPSKDEVLQRVPVLNNFPEIANFNVSEVNTKDAEKLMKEKCAKNGGPTAYDTAKESYPYLGNCVQSLVNVSELETEMAEARPRGELDAVFTKYCKKIPTLKKCVKNFTNTIEPCLEAEERESVNVIHNITSSLLQFICDNEGDRIAMFIAGGGKECLADKQQQVQTCANETFHSYIPVNNPAEGIGSQLTKLPSLILGIEECTDIETFQRCAVAVLEECEDPTPANVVDSLLNFVKKVTPCQNLLKAHVAAVSDTSKKDNGSGGAASVVNVFLVTIAMAVFSKFL